MSPRRLGVVSFIVVCWSASSARKSRWPICQYARRARSAEPMTANAISRTRARPRESVRPIVRSGRSAPRGHGRTHDDRCSELAQPGIDRQLADGGFLSEPVEVGEQLLLADEERVALATEPVQVV